jgi:hypothetical protein
MHGAASACHSCALMAGRIPEKFIDDLLARVDIVDVIPNVCR